MRDILEFVKAAVRNPLEVSTVFPTSRFLAETLLAHGDVARADRVVELGCGTGAISKHLLPKIHPPSYLGIEIDPKMVAFMRARYPGWRFEAGLAENVNNWVEPGTVDVVVSSLPWTVFSSQMQGATIAAILQALKPGGVFVTYICANALLYPQANSFVEKLKSGFAELHRSSLEWRNLPPAFVFKSTKAHQSPLIRAVR